MQCLVEWVVLRGAGGRGVFAATPNLAIGGPSEPGAWPAETCIMGDTSAAVFLRQLLSGPTLFPFEIDLSTRDLKNSGFEVLRHGLDEGMVSLKRG